jgi:hypothetical protein
MTGLRGYRGGAGAVAVLAFAVAAHSSDGCASHGQSDSSLCTPGAFVFCRCQDRSEGSKQCSADGKSFAACLPCPNDGVSHGDDAGPPDDQDGGFTPVDAGDAGEDAGPPPAKPIDPQCAGKLTMLAGSGDTNNQFLFASTFDGTAFKAFSSSGVPLRSEAQMAFLAGKLHAVYRSRDDMLVTVTFDGTSWAVPRQVPGASTDLAPAITAWGATAKTIFHASDGRYHASTYDQMFGWDAQPELIGSTTAPAITNGSAPTVVGAGTPDIPLSAVMVGFTDSNSGIYREEWHGTTWLSVPIKATSVLAANMRPSLVALTAGDYDLLSTWVGTDSAVHAATRTSHDHGSVWSNPSLVSAQAQPVEGPTAAALDGGRALLVYRDSSKKPFYTVFDPTKTPSWTDPAELVAGKNPTVASTPSVAKDGCGADAVVAYAEEDGVVAVMRFAKDAWSGPYIAPGLSKLTYASIGAMP